MTASDRYYALCAASALIHFVGFKRKIVFNDKSLRVVYESMKGGSTAQAGPDLNDRSHVHQLGDRPELGARAEQPHHERPEHTLLWVAVPCDWPANRFATLDACFTPMGKRLLRASILQPNNCGYILRGPAARDAYLTRSRDSGEPPGRGRRYCSVPMLLRCLAKMDATTLQLTGRTYRGP